MIFKKYIFDLNFVFKQVEMYFVFVYFYIIIKV